MGSVAFFYITMNTLKLASGTQMPLIGFGLWKVPKESCADVVYNAIKAGYRLFDGASGMRFPRVLPFLVSIGLTDINQSV